MTLFVDSSVWFAAIVGRDRNNARAKLILREAIGTLVITDHILVETWSLLSSRHRHDAAETFWRRVREGIVLMEKVTELDLDTAWMISEVFSDQSFSLVDRTSFVVMERLGITRAASFDDDYLVYRYGPKRDRAFHIIR